MIDLKQIFDKHGCDKSSKHQYHLIYQRYLESLRDHPINILEVGIFEGKSVQAWLEYFPNATIYCIDIFVRVPPEKIPVLKNSRVRWAKCDSTNIESVANLWPNQKFDVIIDDGLHTPRANRLTFEHLIGRLNTEGFYFIEDVFPLDEMTKTELDIPWIRDNAKDYNILDYIDFIRSVSEFQYNRHDNRSLTKQPDSYIFTIQKISDSDGRFCYSDR